MGVAPPEAAELAGEISKLPNVRFCGIAFYPGHIKRVDDEPQICELSALIASLRHLNPAIVSGGSTPLLFRSHQIEGVNEIRPGTYVFNDMNTVASGGCSVEDCAASILVTVVSHTRADRMIVDGGSKTFSSDRDASGGPAFGRLADAPDAVFHRMNEEHGFIDLTRSDRKFEIGEKTRIIPNHICVAVNLHEVVYGVRGGKVEEIWKTEGRGKLQ